MKRSGPLKRRTPLRSSTPLPKVGKRAKAQRSDLDAFRAAVRERAGGWCEANTPSCPPGRHHGSEAHHRLMRSQGGTHHVDNGLWVCGGAHIFIHAQPGESYARGWLIRSWEVA